MGKDSKVQSLDDTLHSFSLVRLQTPIREIPVPPVGHVESRGATAAKRCQTSSHTILMPRAAIHTLSPRQYVLL